MGTTRRIERADWKRYFDGLTAQQLADDGDPKAATIEHLSTKLGDRVEPMMERLSALLFDPESETLDVRLGQDEHLTMTPSEIWVIEEEGGFVSTLELLHEDGAKEIIYVRRSGPPALRHEGATP